MRKVNKSEVYHLIKSNRYDLAAEVLMKAMEPSGAITDSPSRVWEYLKHYTALRHENFIAVYLNNKNVVIDHEVVSKGTVSETMIHPREVFIGAVARAASGVILAHNHPSGVPTPSQEDWGVTKRLVECGSLLGIRVIDHVILTKHSYLSLRESDQEVFTRRYSCE